MQYFLPSPQHPTVFDGGDRRILSQVAIALGIFEDLEILNRCVI